MTTDKARWWRSIYSSADLTAADRRNNRRVLCWVIAWAVSLITANWVVLDSGYSPDEWVARGLAIVPYLVAAMMLRAYLRFLREADELVRRIQVEGLAWGLGFAVVFTWGYPLLEGVGAPGIQMQDLAALMTIAATAGTVFTAWRYR